MLKSTFRHNERNGLISTTDRESFMTNAKRSEVIASQVISITFERDTDELTTSAHLGLSKQLLEGILYCTF